MACGASKASSMSCARPSRTARMCRASRRCALAVARSTATATGSRGSTCCTRFAQNEVAPNETSTAGYNLLRAEISYAQKFKDARLGEPREFTVGLVGNNLLNEDIRNHASYTKDEVLMPGANVRAFANVKF